MAALTVLMMVSPLCFVQAAFSTPQLQWSKTYYGDAGRAIQTRDGGFIVAANNASIMFYPAWQRAPMLIKTDSSGTVEWNRTFDIVGLVGIHSVVQTKDGGYAVSGANIALNTLNPAQATNAVYTGWLIKTDAHGSLIWNKTFELLERCYVIETGDGGYVLVGFSSVSLGESESVLVKMDSNANTVWSKTLGENSTIALAESVVEVEGGFVAVGVRDHDGWLIKTDADGNLQWSQTYRPGSFSTFLLLNLAKTADGGFLLVGGNLESGWLVKTDSQGSTEWIQYFPIQNEPNQTLPTNLVVLNSAVQTADKNYVAVATVSRQARLITTDPSGNVLSSVSYGEVGENVSSSASSVALTNDGGFVVSGSLNRYSPSTPEGFNVTATVTENVWLAKFAPQSTDPVPSPSVPELSYCAVMVLVFLVTTIVLVNLKRKVNAP